MASRAKGSHWSLVMMQKIDMLQSEKPTTVSLLVKI